MPKFLENYKDEMINFKALEKEVRLKKRVLYQFYSIFFAFFFISALLAVLINLLLFVKYFYLVSLGIAFLLFIFINLKQIIYRYLLKRERKEAFSTKTLLYVNLGETLILCLGCYIVAIIVWSVI